MFDLALIGGDAVLSGVRKEADILIQGGKVAAIAEVGSGLEAHAIEVVNCRGLAVTPGGIEAHAHLDTPVSEVHAGYEGARSQSVRDGTLAALLGGTTTVIDFAMPGHGKDLLHPLDAVEARRLAFEGKSLTDFAFHAVVTDEVVAEFPGGVGDVIAGGTASLKIFTTGGQRRRTPPLIASGGAIREVLYQARDAGGIVAVHAEDEDLVEYGERLARESGLDEWHRIGSIRSAVSERLAFERMIALAGPIGTPIYFMHVTCGEGVSAISKARRSGQRVFGEALHNYLAFTAEDVAAPEGAKFHTFPALKHEEDRRALWDSLIHCQLDVVATDDYTTDLKTKLHGRTVFDLCGGHAGIETRASYVLSEGVNSDRVTIERFVEVVAENPARLFGLYPRKGTIAVGSDADLVLWDVDRIWSPTIADLNHGGDYSIWENWRFRGWPTAVVAAGTIVARDRRLVNPAHRGNYLERRLDANLLPALVR